MNILADASLPGLDAAFPPPFKLTRYNHDKEVIHLLDKQNILLCRATLKVDRTLLKNHHLLCVATASSGTDHLDSAFLSSQNTTIIDAKGSNAPAVADYVIASLAYLKKHHLFNGKTAGIIGMGHVGTKVYERLNAIDFQVITYDPPKTIKEPSFASCTLEALFQCDLLCIHAELQNTEAVPSINLINHQFLERVKEGCVIINASRGGIVNETALLNSPKSFIYCTDVYLNEPTIDKRIIEIATLCSPHIAGHSIEAKYGAVTMVSNKIHHFAGLPVPQFKTHPETMGLEWQTEVPWQNQILTLYSPFEESLSLKQAVDKKEAFLELRKVHQMRHNFSTYFSSPLPEQTKLLLGST